MGDKTNCKPVLVLMVGLPRSGKSTEARKISATNGWPIVNPDSIRLAMHGRQFVPEAEPFVWAVAKTMVRSLFLAGHDRVILDATNTTRRRREEWRSDHWRRVFVIWGPPAAKDDCLAKAMAANDTKIIDVIERMADAFEDVGDDERDPE